jgi:hypothetical protein
VIDPENPSGATFWDLNDPATLARLQLQLELTQTNKILPEPCDFLFRESLPLFGDSPYIHSARGVLCHGQVLHGRRTRPTSHSQIREADAAHAMSSPFLYTICGRCISNGESK